MGRYYDIDGVSYPSVTTIIDMLSKPGLYRFYAQYGWNDAKKIASMAASLGTEVHNYIDKVWEGELKGKIQAQDKGLETAFNNFIDFQELYKPEPVLTEHKVYSPTHGYAGTLDGLFKAEGKLILLDWKTSTRVYPEYELQLNAYYQALTEMKKCGIISYRGKIKELWIVRLDKTKEFKDSRDVKKYEPKEEVFEAFLGLLKVYNWKNKRRDK